jgi:hypothetical protein
MRIKMLGLFQSSWQKGLSNEMDLLGLYTAKREVEWSTQLILSTI